MAQEAALVKKVFTQCTLSEEEEHPFKGADLMGLIHFLRMSKCTFEHLRKEWKKSK